MKFGEKLKALRKSNNLSQAQLAELVNVKANTVCDWEHNRYYPDVTTIKRLCEIFDTTATYLIDDMQVEIEHYSDIALLARFFSYYIRLSNKDKETINQLIVSLSEK